MSGAKFVIGIQQDCETCGRIHRCRDCGEAIGHFSSERVVEVPKIINSKAVITISAEVTNSDGSAFTVSKTRTVEWSEAHVAQRRAALEEAVKQLQEDFMDRPIDMTND